MKVRPAFLVDTWKEIKEEEKMKDSGVLKESRNEFRIARKDEIKAISEYLEEELESTVLNKKLLRSIAGEGAENYNGIGELKIEIKITHEY